MSRYSRLILTIVASVFLHAGVFFVLWWVGPGPAPRVAAPEAVEMELVYLPPQPVAPPAPTPEVRPPARTNPPPARKVQRPTQPPPVAQEEEEKGKPELARPTEQMAQKTEEPARPEKDVPLREDVPRASPPLTLVPRNLPGAVPVPAEEPLRGRTVHNLPGEAPDPEAMAAYQAEEAKALVDGWAADTLAAARAERGAVPPYFRQLKGAFAEQLVEPPSPDLKVVGKRMVREELDAIEHFGKTGSPVPAPEKREHRLEQRNRIQAAAEAGRATNMYMVDVTSPVLALAAVVEVWQEPDGRLRDVKVLESSGDPTFDNWALSRLRHALAKTFSPPDAGVGIHDEGIRTRWRLEEYLGNPRVQIHLIGVY